MTECIRYRLCDRPTVVWAIPTTISFPLLLFERWSVSALAVRMVVQLRHLTGKSEQMIHLRMMITGYRKLDKLTFKI